MSKVNRAYITIVSGLPRSGTSLMMQMLQAGGMPILADQKRAADEDNPRGYLEFEAVKSLKTNAKWLDDAAGKAVKIIHLLLLDLPDDRAYRIIFMNRDLDEVIQSQAVMLRRLGKPPASVQAPRLKAAFEGQLATVRRFLSNRPTTQVLDVDYAELIHSPMVCAEQVNAFLDGDLDSLAMSRAIDPELYRNRNAAKK